MTALDFLIEKQSFVSDEWLFFISRKRKRFLERVAEFFLTRMSSEKTNFTFFRPLQWRNSARPLRGCFFVQNLPCAKARTMSWVMETRSLCWIGTSCRANQRASASSDRSTRRRLSPSSSAV